MDSLLIRGGQRLEGELAVSGSKNAALPILFASLLVSGVLELENVPALRDVKTSLQLLRMLGVQVSDPVPSGRLVLDASRVSATTAPYELVKTMRASILVLGPLVARFGEARVSLPGGCAIGQRPVDQHIRGLEALGAQVEIDGGYIVARATRLKGARILTDMVTVTGTANLLMAACLADGETVIDNAAREPEVVDLARALVSMGAQIAGIGSDRLVVQGQRELRPSRYRIMSDRIEAGTLLCAVAATGGVVTLHDAEPATMAATLERLTAAGAAIETGSDWVRLRMTRRPSAVSVRTAPYPGFATDMQAQFMALGCIASGTATVIETIFENRFMHVQELIRLGADIHIDGHMAVINGVDHLSGAAVMATDLRASAGLVIAGLCARGQTRLERLYHLDRGYVALEQKLAAIGADIVRQRESERAAK